MATEVSDKALQRARKLLTPAWARRADQADASRGYLDLLGEELESTGPAQDLMTTRLVPTVYERYWRPALARAIKGLTGPGMAGEAQIARLLLGLGPGDRVLDVACGPGNFSRQLARDVGEEGLVVGADASPTMLERGAAELARSGQANVALVRCDATSLPFRKGSFHGVICFAALHLCAEPVRGLDEMRRVLRDGGRIALMTSVRRQLTARPLKPVVERTTGMRLFEADEITAGLESRGFTGIYQRLAGMVQFVGGRLK